MMEPEKIKRKLITCTELNMSMEVMCEAMRDALAYIQQLESTYSQLSKALCGKDFATLEEILAAVDQLKPRWISVEERLPEREEDVLLLFETGIITGGFICDSNTWCAYSDGEYYTDCSNNPTYWMPLPEPPKEDAHD